MVRRRMSCKIDGLVWLFWTAFSGIRDGVLHIGVYIQLWVSNAWDPRGFSQICGAFKLFRSR